MTLFFFGYPGHLLNLTVMEGMIWYVLPMTLITLNDITAYYVGFFFGKTPLIKVQRVQILRYTSDYENGWFYHYPAVIVFS